MKQKVRERRTIESGDCAGVVRCRSRYRLVEALAVVSYKRMIDLLYTNLSSLNVFTAALFFRYRR